MKKLLSFILVLAMLIGLMPTQVFATEAGHSHAYESEVTAPTCTEKGYTTYTCACGDSYVDDYVDADGEHDFTDWYTTKQAAYNADGEESRDCKKCSHVEFRSVKLEVITSGNVGKGTPYTDDVTYTLYADGTMVISGNGIVYCSDWRGDYQPYKDYRTQVKALIVEEGITATGGGCFAHFYNLEIVSLPNSLTKIDGNAFMSSFDSSITSVVIPKTVTYIGAYSYGFYYGKGGTTFNNIIIENPNVRFVDNKAVFNAGNNLENLTLYSYGENNNVSAYAQKYGCKYVDLEVYKTGVYSGVAYMYYDGVLTLSAVQNDAIIDGEDAPWNAEKNSVQKIVIESGITGIAANAFKNYYKLESVETNNEIRHVGDGAFSTTESCDRPLTLALPRTVQSIGTDVFAGRQNVTLTAYLGSAAAEIDVPGVKLDIKKQFKLLLIGNSYSEDASGCGSGMTDSQLLNILQAMLGEDAEVAVALLSSGGKGINWHATQAEQGNAAYSFKTIFSNSPTWTTIGSASSYQALTWTDWDVVSLQPYNISASTGIEAVAYPDSTDAKFCDLETASEYMLDYIGTHAPNADIYCYMHWSQTTGTTLNANLNHYNRFAKQYLGMMEHEGTSTGTKYTSIIPVGLSIQNARSTYLALLSYNVGATLNLTTDTQMGLQRDGGHLSFNVGRYIAGLTFAETIVPDEWRADDYVLPEIRITESVGKLPKEYSVIAQKSVLAAVNGWKNGSLAVTNIDGYTQDPIVAASELLQSIQLRLNDEDASLLAQLESAVLAALPADFAASKIEIDENAMTAEVTIRFGYTFSTVTVSYATSAIIVSQQTGNGEEKIDCYESLEEALAAATNGTIKLLADTEADTVILRPGIALDLNGCTLTADIVLVMDGATILDGNGLLKVAKKNLVYAKNQSNEVIPVWNGVDGYVFTQVTFQQTARKAGESAAEYIFLPAFSNEEVAILLSDGVANNDVKIKVCLTWNNGTTQQLYTYSDSLVEQVFDGTGRLAFKLTVTGIGGIADIVASPIADTESGARATIPGISLMAD